MAPDHELLHGLTSTRRHLVRACADAGARRGEAVYLVGGPVRDLLLGRPVEDIDVVVVGDGLAVAQRVARALGGRLTRYHAFGTARIDLADGHRLDVATARAEAYQRPGVLPEVRQGTLADDLGRRDFTINAMAVGLGGVAGESLQDPLGGRRDLDAGLVRYLHEGSFIDDPSRMLRAVRFALRFGYALEAGTRRALEAGVRAGYLESISGDRLRREFAKLLQEQPVAGPLRLQADGLLATIAPGLRADEAMLRALVALIAAATVDAGPAEVWPLVLAALSADLDVQARWQLARRLRLSRDDRAPLIDSGAPWQRFLRFAEAAERQPSELAAALDPLVIGAILVGSATLRAAGRAALADSTERYLQRHRDLRSRLDAAQLGALGCPAGPPMGELLRVLRGARIDGLAGDLEAEAELARAWLRERQIDPPESP